MVHHHPAVVQGDGLVQRESTAALRARSADRLAVGFGRYVAAEAAAAGWDPRDAMIDMTPFIDCARRLGLDPVAVLGPVAAGGPAWFRETFEVFVRRTDVTLGAFGWSVVDDSDGPRYVFAWPD